MQRCSVTLFETCSWCKQAARRSIMSWYSQSSGCQALAGHRQQPHLTMMSSHKWIRFLHGLLVVSMSLSDTTKTGEGSIWSCSHPGNIAWNAKSLPGLVDLKWSSRTHHLLADKCLLVLAWSATWLLLAVSALKIYRHPILFFPNCIWEFGDQPVLWITAAGAPFIWGSTRSPAGTDHWHLYLLA